LGQGERSLDGIDRGNSLDGSNVSFPSMDESLASNASPMAGARAPRRSPNSSGGGGGVLGATTRGGADVASDSNGGAGGGDTKEDGGTGGGGGNGDDDDEYDEYADSFEDVSGTCRTVPG